MSTWVLVADGSRARLLILERKGSLTEVEAFACPEERLREQDLLVIIAAPAFLGHLRSKISGETQKLVALSVDKDLTQRPLPEIADHIPAVL